MASIALTFVNSKEGMQSVSFNMDDSDLSRIYEAYKYGYMQLDQGKLDLDTPDDDQHDHRVVEASNYDMRAVFTRLSDELVYQIVTSVQQYEMNKVVKDADIKLIDIKV